jgi:hypothetical protein
MRPRSNLEHWLSIRRPVGIGARPTAIARRRWFSRGGAQGEHAGLGLSWPSGLGFGRYQALEVEHNVGNSCRCSRRGIRARVVAPHGEGGSGSRRQGERARAEEDREGKGARRAPYHTGVLRRRLEAEDRGRRCRIAVAQGELAAALSSGRAAARWR